MLTNSETPPELAVMVMFPTVQGVNKPAPSMVPLVELHSIVPETVLFDASYRVTENCIWLSASMLSGGVWSISTRVTGPADTLAINGDAKAKSMMMQSNRGLRPTILLDLITSLPRRDLWQCK